MAPFFLAFVTLGAGVGQTPVRTDLELPGEDLGVTSWESSIGASGVCNTSSGICEPIVTAIAARCADDATPNRKTPNRK